MLNHQKLVLLNVAYDKELFRKELNKSLIWLSSDEVSLLKEWVIENFTDMHPEVIRDVFNYHQVVL